MDPLFATGHIALWLLIAGLFFPRLALLFAWLGTGTYGLTPEVGQIRSVVLPVV